MEGRDLLFVRLSRIDVIVLHELHDAIVDAELSRFRQVERVCVLWTRRWHRRRDGHAFFARSRIGVSSSRSRSREICLHVTLVHFAVNL